MVTQADVDAGSVTDTATAGATSVSDVALTSPTSSVIVPASEAVSALSLADSTASTGYGAAGDTISYNYLVTNTGTTTLSGISISDSLIPSGAISCPAGTLAPEASVTCTGTYQVTQADVDAGSVTDTATAGATNPAGDAEASAPSSVTVGAAYATSGLTLVDSSPTTSYGAAGDTISYNYLVTNTGTTTLSGISISDSLIPSGAISCPAGTLAPEASVTCTGTYQVTQADVDAGSVTDTATAGATNPAGDAEASAPSSVTVGAVVISGVTFEGTSSAPKVLVTGFGFGSRPATVPACNSANTDFANAALWIEDTTTFTSSGEPGNCVGLKISTYTATEIVFTFGPAYRGWPALASGDGYQLTVAGSVVTGTVTYDTPAVVGVKPASGPGAGGTKVTVSGVDFAGTTSVLFGSAAGHQLRRQCRRDLHRRLRAGCFGRHGGHHGHDAARHQSGNPTRRVHLPGPGRLVGHSGVRTGRGRDQGHDPRECAQRGEPGALRLSGGHQLHRQRRRDFHHRLRAGCFGRHRGHHGHHSGRYERRRPS